MLKFFVVASFVLVPKVTGELPEVDHAPDIAYNYSWDYDLAN